MDHQYRHTYFWRAGGSPPALSFYFFDPKLKSHNYYQETTYKACTFSIVHYKFIAFNCCKVLLQFHLLAISSARSKSLHFDRYKNKGSNKKKR